MQNLNIDKSSWRIKFHVPSGAKFAKPQGFCFEWLEPDFVADNLTNWSGALRYLYPIQEFSFNWEKSSTLRIYCIKLSSRSGNRGVLSQVVKKKDKHFLQPKSLRSLSYLAPEVLKGKPYQAIPADVWSAGVSIYVILNNTHPFKADDITSMRVNQMKKKWSFLPSVEETLSRSAKMIVARMLQPNPEERPSMNEIIACSWLRGKCHSTYGS
ncbi:hypothetical protein AVEN_138731-1 [Araneus ventricosus]|uniref:Protein kinase domain-containing protein n=1 Tax=Araneus ventricosus TaxID=182803 RepID=A0A4Y2VPN3_ARAVE|nr:hypothetical protein AVEN_138731-1 [Araneus ventricosus]